MELAKSEMKREVSKVGKGAGMLGAAGVAGHLMLFFLSFALTFLLDNWMPVELAAVIVALLWAVVAAVLAARGRKELKEADPQLPVTQQTLKEDVQWARAQKS
jgi:nitrate/nitrite transporter NarK